VYIFRPEIICDSWSIEIVTYHRNMPATKQKSRASSRPNTAKKADEMEHTSYVFKALKSQLMFELLNMMVYSEIL
jgi:hypothetical protein